MSSEKLSLRQEVLDQIRHVLREFTEVEKAWIFGSRTQGKARNGSDIDLAISAPQLEFHRYLALRQILNDRLLHQVDVVHLEKIKDRDLRSSVETTRIEIYERS